MTLRETPQTADSDRFGQELSSMIDLRQPLLQLSQKIDWPPCEPRFVGLYAAGVGRLAHAIRLMAGLQLLKHTCNVSAKEVVASPIHNQPASITAPYIQ
ncbi:MAG: hypothetical protein ACK499_13070 [Betaproteobacteria bacterium]|jgi:IS5 family transposase